MWLIPGFSVWGLPETESVFAVAVEKVGADRRIMVSRNQIGGAEQTVTYANLSDHRGNPLPQTISNPAVIPLNKSHSGAFVIGQESATAFKIARDPDTAGSITVDLLIIEMS